MTTNDRFAAQEIDQTIRKNLAKLRKPGVLTVRPGFEITGDQLTGKQAIVATAHGGGEPGCRLRNPVEISRRHAAFAGDRDVRLHVRLPAEGFPG